MKKNLSIRGAILFGLVAVLLLTAAVPSPAGSVSAAVASKSDLIRLVVDNKSSGKVYIQLTGPAFYYLIVSAEEAELFTIKRGEYLQTVTACGDTVKDEEVDLTTNTRMVMPVCGGRAKYAEKNGSGVDLASIIQIVKITVINDASTRLIAIFEGPATYVFSLAKDDEKDYTVAKGTYDITYYACGKSDTRMFTAYKGKEITFKCPK